MKLSRTKFKHAIRKCKKDKETIIADIIAEKMCQKDPCKFWKDVKHRVNNKTKIPTYSEFFPVGNGVKQGGKLSPLLFNVYMDDLSVQLHTKPIGCSLGKTVVNHLIYADDLLLFAPSGKGLQTLLDCCYIYSCEYDVQVNASKSLIMYFDSRNANLAREMTLGRTKLNFTISCKYLGHVICNDLSDKADIQAKVSLIYAA